MNQSCQLILFDFFNTLVSLNPSNLPVLHLDGRKVISTAGMIQDALSGRYPKLKGREVFHAMDEAGRTIRKQWGDSLKELPAIERFRLVVRQLGLEGGEATAQELLEIHMSGLRNSYQFLDSVRDMLKRLEARFRLALFSNCDYAPTVLTMLEENRISPFFDPIVISETIGFRKPGRAAFEAAIAATGESMDKMIFVGDSLDDDIAGAHAIGLKAVWLNLKGASKPARYAAVPEIASITELPDWLENHLAG